jgi:hypothetical protein
VIQSTSAAHTSTLQAETAARRQAEVDRKWRARAQEEEGGVEVEEDAAARQRRCSVCLLYWYKNTNTDVVFCGARREEAEVQEALRRIEEKRATATASDIHPAPTTEGSLGAREAAGGAETKSRFAEAGEVFGYGGAAVLYEKKGAKVGGGGGGQAAHPPAPSLAKAPGTPLYH